MPEIAIFAAILLLLLTVNAYHLYNINARLAFLEKITALNYDLPQRIELEARLDEQFKLAQERGEQLARWDEEHDGWEMAVREAKERDGEIQGFERILD